MSYIVVPKLVTPPVREPTAAAPPRAIHRLRPPVDAVQKAPVLRVISAPESAEEGRTPVVEAPASTASPSPTFDMAALRADARRIGKDHAPDPFEQVRDAESRLEAEKNKLGRAIEQAKRPPCTKKYSGGTSLNLVLLIPLAIDTITDTGCKW